MKKILPIIFFLATLFTPSIFVHADNAVMPDITLPMKVEITNLKSAPAAVVPGTDIPAHYQVISAHVTQGEEKDKDITFTDDYPGLRVGATFYITKTTDQGSGTVYYAISGPDRTRALLILALIFVAVLLIFGGVQGVRGLISLAGSFILILYVLLPGLTHGFSPILMSAGAASLIIILGSYVTHGFNKTTTAAVAGMITTVIFVSVFAYFAVHFIGLTGYNSDEAVYLTYNLQGIDIVSLLFAGMIIGLLGVLYDSAISQAIAVEELHSANPSFHPRILYKRALRIGREHIGALVNTIAIAYVGVSLPLLLLYSSSSGDHSVYHIPVVNQEIFATEIVRIIVGGIGVILSVPLTTWIAVAIITRKGRGEKKAS